MFVFLGGVTDNGAHRRPNGAVAQQRRAHPAVFEKRANPRPADRSHNSMLGEVWLQQHHHLKSRRRSRIVTRRDAPSFRKWQCLDAGDNRRAHGSPLACLPPSRRQPRARRPDLGSDLLEPTPEPDFHRVLGTCDRVADGQGPGANPGACSRTVSRALVRACNSTIPRVAAGSWQLRSCPGTDPEHR